MNSAILLLEDTTQKHPDRIALEDEGSAYSYRNLRDVGLRIGTALLQVGIPDAYVLRTYLIYLPRSAQVVVSFMGVLYGGGAYVPVDFHMGGERLQRILDNLRPAGILTNAEGAENLQALAVHGARVLLYDELVHTPPDEALVFSAVSRVIDTDPIYVMFTSGSTGIPKGVVIPHRGVMDYARWVTDTFAVDEHTVMGTQAAFYFDNSILDIYGCFSTGGKMVVIPDALFLYPSKLPAYVEEKGINFIFWVPTVMIAVANAGVLTKGVMPKLTKVLFCGEVMPNAQLNVWRRALAHALFANLYGPTEITDVCAYYIVDRLFADSDSLPIGRACRNTRLLILNEKKERAAVGEIGELCVLGSGVALGYWNAPDISEPMFVQNPCNPYYHERLYRTGDLAFEAEDGLILFLGRRDSQIKLHGNRIELGEIETAARQVSGVANACALFDAARQRIVLFTESDAPLVLRKMCLEMKAFIPKYMLPAKLVVMPKLPLTGNGKIDRVALRDMLPED